MRGCLGGSRIGVHHQSFVISNSRVMPSSPNIRLISGARPKPVTLVGESVTRRLISPPCERSVCSNAPCDLVKRTAHKRSAHARVHGTAASIDSRGTLKLWGSVIEGFWNHVPGFNSASQ